LKNGGSKVFKTLILRRVVYSADVLTGSFLEKKKVWTNSFMAQAKPTYNTARHQEKPKPP